MNYWCELGVNTGWKPRKKNPQRPQKQMTKNTNKLEKNDLQKNSSSGGPSQPKH